MSVNNTDEPSIGLTQRSTGTYLLSVFLCVDQVRARSFISFFLEQCSTGLRHPIDDIDAGSAGLCVKLSFRCSGVLGSSLEDSCSGTRKWFLLVPPLILLVTEDL